MCVSPSCSSTSDSARDVNEDEHKVKMPAAVKITQQAAAVCSRTLPMARSFPCQPPPQGQTPFYGGFGGGEAKEGYHSFLATAPQLVGE